MRNNIDNEEVIEMFYEAIIDEIEQYPCLGLVSNVNNGCHKDMDYNLFIKSSEIFKPMLWEINKNKNNIKEFDDLKKIGYKYEKLMFEKTKGVNTQKGLIFCVSIFYFCYVNNNFSNYKELSKIIKKFCIPLKKKIKFNSKSIGDSLFFSKKIKGAKFEAINGYKIIFDSLNFYYKKIDITDHDDEIKKFILLLYVMLKIKDTTLINKIGIEKYKLIMKSTKKIFNELLKKRSYNELFKFNKYCIENNISPGGSADLVVIIFFLIKINSIIRKG